MKTLTRKAYAKVNLTLDVLGKRPDGFHDMRMVMQAVTLSDTITLRLGEGEGIRAKTNKNFLPRDDKNLAVIAALRFYEAIEKTPAGLLIDIKKRIPVCAGTAGGSSDAAAVLHGLNELTGAGFTVKQLMELGLKIGADVPYCVMGGTALAEGKGEILTPLRPLPHCFFVLCKPKFSVPTPELFKQLDKHKIQSRPDTDGLLSALEKGNLPDVARRMYNVFEVALSARRQKQIREIRHALMQAGALGATMSGTGPTVLGLFDRRDLAERAVSLMRESPLEVFLAEPV
ncbi:MAG: 4-(cytidine 5'-diphospho)-2-C-methyl-D-erythritol kinase [Evtepia sp.]